MNDSLFDPPPGSSPDRVPEKVYRPVFAGKTPEDEDIVVYVHIYREEELHILRPDGELWALSPGSEVEMTFSVLTGFLSIKIESPEWTGTAKGNRIDLLKAEFR